MPTLHSECYRTLCSCDRIAIICRFGGGGGGGGVAERHVYHLAGPINVSV